MQIHRGNLSDFVKNLENQRAKSNTIGKPIPSQPAKRNDNEHFVMLNKGNNFEEKNGNDNSSESNGKKSTPSQSQPDGECSELIRKFEAKYKVDTDKEKANAYAQSQEDDKESPTEHLCSVVVVVAPPPPCPRHPLLLHL